MVFEDGVGEVLVRLLSEWLKSLIFFVSFWWCNGKRRGSFGGRSRKEEREWIDWILVF